ncbi:MAG TPA: hypothetical protein VJB87_03895, partial [Candidatus Nanoarchaeia archaeon]|nr:hypothetical protein [Candidatus Nanoarchaeia archaeon]
MGASFWNKEKIIRELQSIARVLGYSPSSAQVLISGVARYHFGSFNKAKLTAGLNVQTNYNPITLTAYRPSLEFAYILGVVYGDGSSNIVENDHGSSGNTTLNVTDKDFAQTFKEEIEKWSGLKASYQTDGHFHTVYLSSVDASRIIDTFDVKNVLNWELTLQCAFLRGLFDSDGGVEGDNLEVGNRKYAKRWVHLS